MDRVVHAVSQQYGQCLDQSAVRHVGQSILSRFLDELCQPNQNLLVVVEETRGFIADIGAQKSEVIEKAPIVLARGGRVVSERPTFLKQVADALRIFRYVRDSAA